MAVPSQVIGVTLSKEVRSNRTALKVTWKIPKSDVSLYEYHVQYRRSGTSSWSITTLNSSAAAAFSYIEDPEVIPGSEYQVRVRAVSVIGLGTWSEVKSETTFQCKLLVLVRTNKIYVIVKC